MDNNVHILFRSCKHSISTVMRKLLAWYAQYFNRRHRRTRHLFENRYKSVLCDEETYLLDLLRYIHLTPIRVKLVSTLNELDRYPWSGHGSILGKKIYPWMDTEFVLAQFSGKRNAALRDDRRLVEEGMGMMGRIPELTGGGLVRTSGGWSQMLSLKL